MTAITREHIKFLNDLLIEEIKNTNYEIAQIFVDVLAFIKESKKVDDEAFVLANTSPATSEDLILSKKETTEVSIDSTQEVVGNPKKSTLKETPMEILKKVVGLAINNDIAGVEFIKNLTSVEIESIVSYAKNNRLAVKQNIHPVLKNAFPDFEKFLTMGDDFIEIALSIIERVPHLMCVVNQLTKETLVTVDYYSALLTNESFTIERWVMDQDQLIKFNVKTKSMECDNFCFTVIEDNTVGEQTQMVFLVSRKRLV